MVLFLKKIPFLSCMTRHLILLSYKKKYNNLIKSPQRIRIFILILHKNVLNLFLSFFFEQTIARQMLGHNNALPYLRERTFNRLFPVVAASKSNQAPTPPPPQYLSSYIPPLLQALHYFTEMLTYEISEMTTIEPPYNLSTVTGAMIVTSPKPTYSTTMQTNPSTWWTSKTTTRRPVTTTMPSWVAETSVQDEFVPETSTQKPTGTQTWWKPPQTTMPVTWWKPTTTQR